jgi:hypothetical protein
MHEKHDEQRAMPLILRMRASGVFRNPPVVTPLQDGSKRYMVLDGANRVTALRLMQIRDALVQIVQPSDPGLALQTWNHVVWEMNAARFLSNIRSIPGVKLACLKDADPAQPSLDEECSLALVQSCRGRLYAVCSEVGNLQLRVGVLNALVDCYKDRARFDRTSIREARRLQDIYPSFCGLIIFPQFSINDLLDLAARNYLLPAGVTRFTIAPRALHLNYPLAELAADKPLEDKNQALYKWINERIAQKSVRYYAEPTFLFDE